MCVLGAAMISDYRIWRHALAIIKCDSHILVRLIAQHFILMKSPVTCIPVFIIIHLAQSDNILYVMHVLFLYFVDRGYPSCVGFGLIRRSTICGEL